MLFNSFAFLIFFPIVTILFFVLPHSRRWSLLLLASCIFYMFFKPIYILILFFTIVIDYWAGIKIGDANEKNKKIYLIASIVANVGVLAVFKYFNFFSENLNGAFSYFHSNIHVSYLNIILPIGLSFHTFQAMSYTLEVYWNNQKPERHFGIYALYVMFYPQLVAGPIERPQNMLHQFHEKKYFNYDNIVLGSRKILWGLFKKVVIADRLAIVVTKIYDNHSLYKGLPLIIAAVFFSFQIYCDFSGYSDIAIGTAKVMGFDLMKNFDNPFKSKSITEFWRRWHISLSTWFNDYLFSPIVREKRDWGKFAVIFALFITFSISGLWHGAGWTFIIYGIMHGVATIYEFITKKWRKKVSKALPENLYSNICVLLTFSYVTISWIFFRSKGISQAWYFISHLFDFSHPNYSFLTTEFRYQMILGIALIFGLELIQKVQKEESFDLFLQTKSATIRWVYYIILIILIVNFGVFGNNQFIYFQF